MTTLYILLIFIALMAGWWGGYAFGWRMRGEQEQINRENRRPVDLSKLPMILALEPGIEEAMRRHPAGKRKRPRLTVVDDE